MIQSSNLEKLEGSAQRWQPAQFENTVLMLKVFGHDLVKEG